MVENISIWMTNYIGTFIVGVGLSSYYLGLYKTSISTVNSITMLITSSTAPVLFSALSRCQDDDKAFFEVFYRFQRLVSLIVFPLGFGLFVYRELATSILLGSQWMETADFLGMWALTSTLCIIFSTYNSEVFRSKGKPRLSVLTQALHIVVLIPVMLIFMNRGFAELTMARSIVRIEIILVSSIIAYVAFGIRFMTVLKNVWPQLVSAVIMSIVGLMIHEMIDSAIYEIATVFICCIVYGLCMLIIPAGRRQLKELPIVNGILNRIFKRFAPIQKKFCK